MPPDYFEVIAIAVHLLMTDRKPVRPLPLLVGRTFEAMARFYASENGLAPSVPVEECDEVDAGEWSGGDEMIEGPRTVH